MEYTISQAATLAADYIAADIPVMFESAPGMGKSDLARQLAAGRPLFDFRASLFESVDFKGIPTVINGRTVWNVPDILPIEERDGKGGFLFLDEFTNSALSVQGALLQLTLDRRLGTYVFPSSWRIMLAGNRQKDRASAIRLSTAAANRVAHIELKACPKDWAAWGAANDIHPLVIAFIQFRPELLHVMPKDGVNAFPSPRSWAMTSRAIKASGTLDRAVALAAGLVGQEASIEFKGFLAIWQELTGLIPSILGAPDSAHVPSAMSAKWAIACALARLADVSNMDSIVTYLDRIGREFTGLAMAQIIARAPELKQTRAYVQRAIALQSVQL